MQGTILPALRSRGWDKDLVSHDFTSNEGRRDLFAMTERLGLPSTMTSFMFTFVQRSDGGVVIFLGHPPQKLVEQALTLPGLPPKLVLNQEDMHNTGTQYQLWAFQGEVKTYPISLPLEEALARAGVGPGKDDTVAVVDTRSATGVGTSLLLPTVLAAGLLDGINPCAFAVMAFLVAFLFALRQTRARILQVGGAYVVGMFLVYLAIGLGLMKVLSLLGQPHLISQLGAGLVIALGLLQLKDAFAPGLPLRLTIPRPGWQTIQAWTRRVGSSDRWALPSALVLGGLVGLCTLPCSGGIYVAILGLLSSQADRAVGLAYLLVYNFMYVLPLVVVLVAVGALSTARSLAVWERAHSRWAHLATGVVMVGLGILIFGWLG